MMNKKGVFLIFALWVFLLLSLFCLGLGFRTFIQTRKTKLFLNKFRALNLAISGIKIAEQVLQEDLKDGSYADHLREKWAEPIEKEVKFSSPAKQGKIFVKIEDESSRLNINNIENKIQMTNNTDKDLKVLFKEFFSAIKIDNADKKVDCILDYIDKDTEVCSPDSFDYENKVKNGKLNAPEELLLIKGFSVEDYNTIKDFITVFGEDIGSPTDNHVNVNTLKKKLRDFLFENMIGQEAPLEDVTINNKYYCDDINNCPVSEKDRCVALPGVLPKELFKTNSNIFRIASEGEVDGVKKRITCVVHRNTDSCKILYWYEE